MPLYHLYELNHAALTPARAASGMCRHLFRNPFNPLSHTAVGRGTAAACEIFERTTRRYGRPAFEINETRVGGETVAVRERAVWQKPFCTLRHFECDMPDDHEDDRTKLLIVAPLSGHYATLLRGTVRAMLPRHDVYITEWTDARMVPVAFGEFDLDDYIDYLTEIFRLFRGDVHVMAVCQPSVPVLAAVSLMEAQDDPDVPHSMTLMGGPIDTRINPTIASRVAEGRDIDWFRRKATTRVPWPHPGFMRAVYPGFLHLMGFMRMNLDDHVDAHKELFRNLIRGDGDSAEKHRAFYDEFLAVMDLDAPFYLQTIETVFLRHALPDGTMEHRGRRVDPGAVKRVALMTVEGEKDDITGLGQTEAAHALCHRLKDSKREHHVQPQVGHYGVFNGSRFVHEIAPRISDFIELHDRHTGVATGATRAIQQAAVASLSSC